MIGFLVIIICAVAVLVLVLLFVRDTFPNAAAKGAVGETLVSTVLNKLPEDYLVINNVIVPNQQTTSQIDHVVVSPYGIFVIETKNYTGRIYGTENSKYWKETFRTTGAKSFRNPIKQNWGHIYALSEYLNIDKRVFKPVVVFSNRAAFYITSYLPVVHMSELKGLILSYTQQIIPQSEVTSIFSRISQANLVGSEKGKMHTQTVRENLARQNDLINQGICPRCGGTLVLRNGRFGQFFGCSNYPQCRFTFNPDRRY